MIVLKSAGNVYGGKFTAAEKKVIDLEVKRELKEYIRRQGLEFDALVLWQLHEQFGFGPERLRRFYDNFRMGVEELAKRYDFDNSDSIWLATQKLKDYGIDLEEWERS